MNVADALKDRIERLEAIDRVAERVQGAVGKLVPQDSRLKDVLSGTWMREPLHPPLTDVVVGCWTSAVLVDLVGGKEGEAAARKLIGLGVLAALPTAASGASDWAEIYEGPRRVGFVHAAGNTTALSLFALSYLARRQGRVATGRLLSALGMGVATVSAYLGGHLAFGRGVGVNQTVFEESPAEWTAVADESELRDGELVRGAADGTGILLVKRGDRIFALADRCSHRGCPLHDGTLGDGTVTCPCHGSTFRLEDGAIVSGPATAPQPSFEARRRDGKIEVRARKVE